MELFLGGPERTENWLPLGAEADYINLREFVTDWEHGPLPELVIERLDAVDQPLPLTPEGLARAYDQVATWVEASATFWLGFVSAIEQNVATNDLGAPTSPPGAAANMLDGTAIWDLGPGRALLIEFEPPEATYWGIQTYLIEWMIPLDYANRITSLNDQTFHVDDDGRVRVVISEIDPGVPNWLDVTGVPRGLVNYRYVKATKAPAPITTIIDVTDIRDHVPASTPIVGPDERAAQIASRRRGVARRYRR